MLKNIKEKSLNIYNLFCNVFRMLKTNSSSALETISHQKSRIRWQAISNKIGETSMDVIWLTEWTDSGNRSSHIQQTTEKTIFPPSTL